MKTKKTTRLFAIAIAVAMLLTIFPSGALAEEITKTVVQSGNCGTNVTYVLYDDGELVISGEGKITSDPWQSPISTRESITSLVIQEGVTNVMGGAFAGCNKMTTVSLPKTITAIGDLAFDACTSLTEIIIPEGVTTIGHDAFDSCQKLEYISIPKTVNKIGSVAFTKSSSLKEIYVDPENAYYLSDANGALYTKDLKTLIIYPCKNAATEYTVPTGVENISEYAFYDNNIIEKITLPSTLKKMSSNCFGYCRLLEEIAIPEGVEVIPSYAFYHCNSLKTISLPDSLKEIQFCSFDYTDIVTLNIPENVTTIGTTFTSCDSLVSVTLPASLTSISSDYAFKLCPKLEKITVDKNNTKYISDEYGALYNYDQTTLYVYPAANPATSYVIPDTVTFIDNQAFDEAKNLEHITIPDSVETIERMAFDGCSSLEEIKLPSKITTLYDSTFTGCSSLESIVIPESVTEIQSKTFMDCRKMKYTFYTGSEEKWASINISDIRNNYLTDSAIHYNSTDHTYSETSTDATCSIGGVSTFNCNYCDLSYEETSAEALGHESDGRWIQTIAPTCFSEGEEQSKCIRHDDGVTCDTIFTRTVPADNKLHDWGEWEETTPPTCYSEGEATRICNNDNSHTETKAIETIDHSLGEWTSNSDSTHSKLCQNDKCTHKETESCNFGSWTITKDATDTEEGEKIRICTVCSYRETEIIPVDPYANITTEITNDILTVSGTGSLPTVEAGASHYWDEYAETATAIVIEGEITTIGSNSFTGFSNISTIIIRTPSITIEPDAFVNCSLLENVLIFGNSSFTPESFNGCADAIKVFENADKQHSFNTSDNTINVIPFDFEDTTLQWNGNLTLDAYNFFDIIAAFCNEYDNIKSVKVNSFTGEGFTFYRYNEKTYNSEPIEGNTITNAEFSVLIDSYETGPVYINFNQLCDGITDGSISTFYLIVEDDTQGDILDTEVEVKDEEEKSWFERALEWIVSLLNKLFKILSRFR